MNAHQAKQIFLLPLIAITMLVGCAAPAGDWVKDSAQPLQVDQDKYACLQQAQQPFSYLRGSPGGGSGWGPGWGSGWGAASGYAGLQTNQELYRACMKARGYTWQPGSAPN
jgi:hypothetical protein